MASKRDLWEPYFETHEILTFGEEWPTYLVEKWERNGIGENRLVNSLMYRPTLTTLLAPLEVIASDADETRRLRSRGHLGGSGPEASPRPSKPGSDDE